MNLLEPNNKKVLTLFESDSKRRIKGEQHHTKVTFNEKNNVTQSARTCTYA